MRSPVLDHVERKVPPRFSEGDQDLIRAVSEHVAKHLGPIGWVLHDLISDVVHVDLLWVQPGPKRPFHTFVTCGMSERAMTPPPEWTGYRHAELLLRLPRSWNFDHALMSDKRNSWPLQELIELARLPHHYVTWLWENHTVANGDPPDLLVENGEFSGSILVEPDWAPSGFRSLTVGPGRSVHFFSVIPLYAEELVLARDAGTEVLLERMERAKLTDVLKTGRSRLA